MNPFLDTLSKVSIASKLINQDVSFLSEPEFIAEVYFPALTNDGLKYFKGFRVQYSSLLGPYKGGIRFSPDVTLDEIKSLALEMSLKTSLSNLPFGGGKGGVIIDSKKYSAHELSNVMRGYVNSIADIIGPFKDIPAPDMNTNPALMSVFRDEYERIVRHQAPGVVTGKPIELGGIPGRDTSTAMGGYFIAKSKGIKGDVLIPGFGNAGLNLASILYRDKNYRVIGVSDSKGGIYNKSGLDITKLIEHKKSTGSVVGFSDSTFIDKDELISLDADLLVPSGPGGLITKDNACSVKSRYIIELANGPITREADEVLNKNGVLVYPDIFANSGGVIGSFYEWQMNFSNELVTRDSFNKRLELDMNNNLRMIDKRASELNCSPRESAYVLAIERLIKASKARGY